MPQRAFVGLGSNKGDRKANLLEAVERIRQLPDTRVVKQSSFYESEPLGEEKAWFVNAVIEVETDLAAEPLLKRLLAVEATMGRKRPKGKRWGSRIIDLDLLFYGSEVLDTPNLKLPHPEVQNRRFVLLPLSELAPTLVHPQLLRTVSVLLAGLKDTKKIHLLRVR